MIRLRDELGEDEVPQERVLDWSPEVEKLVALIDQVSALRVAYLNVNRTKANYKAHPRPHTAVDRVEMQERLAAHNVLTSRLLPNRGS